MTSQTVVRARFAPSPTGYLHVGGARTALFNWLFCRRFGGRFILRIEDTDIQRNIEGAEQKLMDDLRWLGILWDEGPDVGGAYGPYRQSERRELYDAAARKLLDSGQAYYAFDTSEELEAIRRQASAEKRSYRYARPDPPPTEADAARARAEGRPVVVRFRVPDEPITVHDEILGDVTFAAGEVEDLVIVKSNGWPTYHFAVVVDDAAMDITHVLRAQEHLMNTPKHVFMQRALGVPIPRFAHLPLVFNIDGTKMSKRDKSTAVRHAIGQGLKRHPAGSPEAVAWAEGLNTAAGGADAVKRMIEGDAPDATTLEQMAKYLNVTLPEIDVHDFRVSGYLPEALTNFVALIGWSPKDDREKLTREEMVEAFALDRINKTSGRFDREKLLAMNTDYAAVATPERLLEGFRDFAEVNGSPLGGAEPAPVDCGTAVSAVKTPAGSLCHSSPLGVLDDATLARVLAVCHGFRTFRDVENKAGALFVPDEQLRYEPDAVRKVLEKKDGAGYAMLERLLPSLEAFAIWTPAALEVLIKEFCEQTGAKMGDVAQPVRVAICGRTISPAIGDSLALLGKDQALRRIRGCLSRRTAAA